MAKKYAWTKDSNKNNKTQTKSKDNKNNYKNIGIWNVKGIKGKEVELQEEMEKMDLHVLGITETKRKGRGIKEDEKYLLAWSGVEENIWAQAGVAIIIDKKIVGGMADIKYVNERIIAATIKIRKEDYTIFVVYGPNENAIKEEKDEFWEKLQQELDEVKTNKIMVIGDLNGRVGNKNEGIEKWLGREGESVRNENGKRIIEF